MAISYRIVTIEDFKDDAETEAALNAEGSIDWELVQVNFSPKVEGRTIATCIFKK